MTLEIDEVRVASLIFNAIILVSLFNTALFFAEKLISHPIIRVKKQNVMPECSYKFWILGGSSACIYWLIIPISVIIVKTALCVYYICQAGKNTDTYHTWQSITKRTLVIHNCTCVKVAWINAKLLTAIPPWALTVWRARNVYAFIGVYTWEKLCCAGHLC